MTDAQAKTLHDAIMRIPPKRYDGTDAYTHYCRGFRDARHAAAQLVISVETQPAPSPLDQAIENLRAHEFERGRQQGMAQERALWELSRNGQEIDAQPDHPAVPADEVARDRSKQEVLTWADVGDAVHLRRSASGRYEIEAMPNVDAQHSMTAQETADAFTAGAPSLEAIGAEYAINFNANKEDKSMLNDTQRRIEAVLARIAVACSTDPAIAGMYSEVLESVLDSLADEDAFGTEGQHDPRGDGRNGEWSMEFVEGVDEE